MKVLLVADEEHAAALAGGALKELSEWDVQVRRVGDLDEAIASAREGAFDVALLAPGSLDSAGEASVARLRDEVPTLPVVVVSSGADQATCVEALREGAEDLLPAESLSPQSLRRAIRHAIERRTDSLIVERGNRAFETFAHTLAHEMRSPLSTVSFAAELLSRQRLDDAGARQVERIRSAVSEMDGVIKGLLEYASATRGARIEEVDLQRVATEIVESLRVGGAPGSIEIDGLPRVRGSRPQLRLVLGNLIRNAVRYASADDPRVRLSAGRAGRAWEIRVEDNGDGIAPEECERVFEMFYRGPRPRHEGAGLGLAICKRVIESRGGRITADGSSLGGCRIRFTLPDDPLELLVR